MKMRKVLSMLLATLMLLTMIPLGAVSVSAATYDFLFPINNGGKIAYVYGYSASYGGNHTGIDIHSNGDDTIYAASSGTVVATANSCPHISIYPTKCEHYSTFGNYIKVKHADGTFAYYGHLKQNSLKVSVGSTVSKGQAIASMGSSGYSSGKHLHFEVRLSDGKTTVNVNPTSNGGSINYSYSGYGGTPSTPLPAVDSIDSGTYLIKNNSRQEYMNVDSGTDANKQNIRTGALGIWEGQIWASMEYEIKPSASTISYSMRPKCSKSRMVNVYADTVSSGKNVCLWDDTGDGSQRWQFAPVSGGYVISNVQNPNCVLDVQSDGNVYVSTYTGAATQIWSLQNTIVYDANGGIGSFDRQFKNYGEPLTLSSTIPTKDGYLFVGWATSANATTAQYTAGSTYTANANATLYAVWKKECNHIYDNDQDPSCNICGAIREVEIPTDAPAFVVEDAKATYGNTFTVTIRTQNNPGVVGLRLRVQYDSDLLDLISAEEGAFVGVTYGPLDSVPFVFTWCDAIHPDNVTNDVVVRLTFCAKEGTDPTETVISLFYDQADVYNSVWEDVYFSTVSGTVQLTNVIPGDMNNDGNVNVRDLGLLQQHLNGWDVNIVLEACDVNADGNVNVRDLGLFQQYLNGWSVELK